MKHSALSLLALFVASSVHAKVINVHPGHNSLQAAIDAADAGDILILQPGSYSDTDHVHVDKTLTIRGASQDSKPVVALSNSHSIYVQGADCNRPISVTVQGIKLVSSNGAAGTSIYSHGCISQINVFENELINTNISNRNNSSVNTAYVIGNSLTNGQIYAAGTELSYVAGNKVVGNIANYGKQSYVVGNSINCRSYNEGHVTISSGYTYDKKGQTCRAVYNHPTITGYVVANQIDLHVDTQTAQTDGWKRGIELYGANQMVASNVIRFNKLNNLSWVGQAKSYVGIWADQAGVYDVFNNIVDMDTGIPAGTEGKAAIHFGATAVGHAQNNIVQNSPNDAIKSWHPTGNVVQIANNICFNNATNCGTDNGNVTSNPLFVDHVNYVLASGSPGINAGYNSLSRADLDKSRADIGIHGGPFGYSQYQAQLQNVTKPFVYPVFNNVNATDANTVAVRALAVSRLK